MTNTTLFKIISYAFGFFLFIFLPSCGGGDDKPKDDGTDAITTSEQNHCTLRVTGGGDADIAPIAYEIEQNTGNVDVVDGIYLESDLIPSKSETHFTCGHIDPIDSMPSLAAYVTVLFAKKRLTDVVPITVTEADSNFTSVDANYSIRGGTSRGAWACTGKHFRTADGYPSDADQTIGTYTLTLDSAQVQQVYPEQKTTVYTVHGSGHFVCPSSPAGNGIATIDVNF